MKSTILYFILFSAAIFMLIYFYTLLSINQSRSIALLQEITEDAAETDDFEVFVRYQSIAHRLILVQQTETYSLHLYEVIAQEETLYRHQLVTFVLLHGTTDHALSIDDTDDQTRMIFKDRITEQHYFDSDIDDDYANRAISYGMDRIGFYYYMFFVDEDYDITLELYEYDGTMFYSDDLLYQYQSYDPVNEQWIPGLNKSEREAMMDLNHYLRPELMKNIGIFLAIDILIGAGIYFFQTYKKRYMN